MGIRRKRCGIKSGMHDTVHVSSWAEKALSREEVKRYILNHLFFMSPESLINDHS